MLAVVPKRNQKAGELGPRHSHQDWYRTDPPDLVIATSQAFLLGYWFVEGIPLGQYSHENIQYKGRNGP